MLFIQIDALTGWHFNFIVNVTMTIDIILLYIIYLISVTAFFIKEDVLHS